MNFQAVYILCILIVSEVFNSFAPWTNIGLMNIRLHINASASTPTPAEQVQVLLTSFFPWYRIQSALNKGSCVGVAANRKKLISNKVNEHNLQYRFAFILHTSTPLQSEA